VLHFRGGQTAAQKSTLIKFHARERASDSAHGQNYPDRGRTKTKEAAKYLSVSPVSVRRLIRRGLIKPNRTPLHILIPIAELERFLAEGQRDLKR